MPTSPIPEAKPMTLISPPDTPIHGAKVPLLEPMLCGRIPHPEFYIKNVDFDLKSYSWRYMVRNTQMYTRPITSS